MTFRPLTTLGLLLISGSAMAAAQPNLAVTIAAPSPTKLVYETGRYDITVANIGNRNAAGVNLNIQLPPTHTSPQVYVLGILGAKSASCVKTGTQLNCNLGTINKFTSKAVFFDIALPENTAPLNIVATGTTTTLPETNPANNTATSTATLLNYVEVISAPRAAHNDHCTGTGLTSFYECTLFPSSISGYDFTFEADGSLTFPTAPPEISGQWSQPSSERLFVEYFDTGILAATFDGYGTGGGCFEGVTVFPDSIYVSPYEICLQ